jgi:hypothetical protein
MMLTTDNILDLLRKMPDSLKPLMDGLGCGIAPIARITLRDTDLHGNKLRLVCGVEFIEDDEAVEDDENGDMPDSDWETQNADDQAESRSCPCRAADADP